VGEGPAVCIQLAPDIVEVMVCLHPTQTCPISLSALPGFPRGVQKILLAGDAVEVPTDEKVAVCWQAREQLLEKVGLPLRCHRRCIHTDHRVW
jgi:hypothetical protein